MISATRRALYGIRDTCGDDVVGCRRRRRGQGRRRKREARRKVRLLALVLVVVVIGVALVLARICSAVRRGIPSVATTAAATTTTTTIGGEGEAGMSTISVAAYGGEAWDRRLADEGRALQDATTNAAAGCTDNNFSEGGWGQVVLLVIAILFTFNGLAIVCDEFFQASLEKISEVYTVMYVRDICTDVQLQSSAVRVEEGGGFCVALSRPCRCIITVCVFLLQQQLLITCSLVHRRLIELVLWWFAATAVACWVFATSDTALNSH